MSRLLLPAFLLSILLAPVGAQEADDHADERLKIARVAMEAKLKMGDALREKGDLDGALQQYREALALYEAAKKAARPAARPRPEEPEEIEEVELPEEEVLEEEIEDIPWVGPEGRGGRRRTVAREIGGALTEDAVDLALKWLDVHQDEDGRWDADGFMKHDPQGDKCDGAGSARHDVGTTSLALLAFLGAGYTDRGSAKENPYAGTVRRGLRYLISAQARDGLVGTRASYSFMYGHAMATLALSEAYWMTRNPRYKKPAQDGLNFIAMARNPYMAWRYEPRGGENDTSVTTWCVMALKSGKFAGLDVDPDAFEGARAWIDKMTDKEFGQVGYNYPGGTPARLEGTQDRFPPEKSQAMTAAGILTRIFCGEDPRKSELIRKGATLCSRLPPKWNPTDGSIDMVYWYFGTLALFQVGGSHWRTWNDAMKTALVENQHPKGAGARAGSWDPIGAWGSDSGRVVATALMAMSLEVYYRYDRVFGVR